ncbi:MAG: hypothetical protein QOJ29_3488 [Thermoleophilaceae bacterium]|jgi:hypothetical protein|nr:hypothetical protein [Thermoleophilaceae bacterium]
MLAVVSAVVAFDRWPGASVGSPAQTLVLNDKPAPIRVSSRAIGPSATPTRVGAGAVALAPHLTAGGPLVAGKRFAAGRKTPVVIPAPAAPAVPAPVQKTLQPVQDTTSPIIDTISNPGTTATQVADGAQSVTDTAGVSLGRISPDVGNVVVGGGQAAAQTVRNLPLPGHILPGH